MKGMTHRITTTMTSVVIMATLPPSMDWMIAWGSPAMMLAKMMRLMPLPIPRWVMSSPIHMMSMAPATSVPTIMMSKMISGASAPAN